MGAVLPSLEFVGGVAGVVGGGFGLLHTLIDRGSHDGQAIAELVGEPYNYNYERELKTAAAVTAVGAVAIWHSVGPVLARIGH